jgi:hypothetical protein
MDGDSGVRVAMGVPVLVAGGAWVGVAVGGARMAQAHRRKRLAPITVAMTLLALRQSPTAGRDGLRSRIRVNTE